MLLVSDLRKENNVVGNMVVGNVVEDRTHVVVFVFLDWDKTRWSSIEASMKGFPENCNKKEENESEIWQLPGDRARTWTGAAPGPGAWAHSRTCPFKNLPMKELAHEQELAHSTLPGWGGVGGGGPTLITRTP